ncbi:MAG: hypothetical protein AAF999_03655 [Pseudomonadota bacterium]
MRRHERRTRPFEELGRVLPDPQVDLDHLYQQIVPAPEAEADPGRRCSATNKWRALQAEFEGQSALFLLHAMTIAISRRSSPPPDVIALFQRIWVEKGEVLAQELPTRWLISAATTFADCGTNSNQRALGMGLTTLFDMIKLHESERRITGQPGDRPLTRDRSVRPAPMPLDMPPYSLRRGDLDRVMLSRLWALCEKDPVIQPLATRMLGMVMTDPRTIFGRLQRIKDRFAS